jgi:hypothetical protein
MKKLQVIQNKIFRSVYDVDVSTSNAWIHIDLGVRILTEEIKGACAELYQRIRQHENPTMAALENYDNHMHYSYTRLKQI